MQPTRSMPQPATPRNPEDRVARQFISFFFLKLDPKFRRLPASEQSEARAEYAAVVKKFADSGTIVVPYSTVGLRADCDFFLWRIDYKLERLQQMQAELSHTKLGQYAVPSLAFLSMSKRSVYVDKLNPNEDADARTTIKPGRGKFIFVYPFVKTRDWYLAPQEARQEVMDEHIWVGNKYPTVKLNTTYSFGIDDQDFVVAFEGDHPEDFVDLVMDLRATQSSKYTVRDTPIVTGIKGTIEEVLETL